MRLRRRLCLPEVRINAVRFHEYRLIGFVQAYKSVPSPVCCGRCPFGLNLDRPGKRAQRTPSEKQKITPW